MEVSLARSLRSLLAAAALLMAAYSIAASPSLSGGGIPQLQLPSLDTVILGVPKSLGFSGNRRPSPPATRSTLPALNSAAGSGTAWWGLALAGVGLSAALLKRRFSAS